jgi:hypothetical protein
MMGAVLLARSADLSRLAQPILLLHTEKDDVASLPEMQLFFGRMGSKTKQIRRINDGCHPILAGAATCPETVDEVTAMMAELVSNLPSHPVTGWLHCKYNSQVRW